MRREELQKSLLNISNLLVQLAFEQILQFASPRSDRNESDLKIILEKYAYYLSGYEKLSAQERLIINEFGLEKLQEISFWSDLISKGDGDRSHLFQTNFRINVAQRSAEVFAKLLDRNSDQIPDKLEAIDQSGRPNAVEVKKVKIIVREGDMPDLTLRGLVNILNDINNIYEAIVRAYQIPHIDLVVGAVDSGSDKSFDIIGVSKAVDIFSKFFLESWDRIRFSNEQKMEKSFKSVSDGLDLIDKIGKSADSKAISQEEAEKLKRTVVRSMDNLLHNGVYTPEVDERSPVRPSEISFERKLMITHQVAVNEPVTVPVSAPVKDSVDKNVSSKRSRRSKSTE